MSYKTQRGINAPQKSTRFKKSLLTISILALSAPSFAQESDSADSAEYDGVVEEIVVSGMRQNLQNAQDIKRNADTFVDSITASDIGSLPDRSVLEALQRLPGVSLERFQAAEDPDHFSVEGSGAVVRGMTATRSEFNGRDSFTADSGRGLSFQDVPPELMAGVDIYKNQSADMIEGGIGGTISLRTRKPFDSAGRQMGFSVDGTWGDIAEEWKPSFSGLFSDRWNTEVGEFGFLISAAKSELVGESHGIQSDVYKRYDANTLKGAEAFVGEDGNGTVWMPQGANLLKKTDTRDREGFTTALQWSDNDGRFVVTGEYIRSKAVLDWFENALKYQGGYKDSDRNTRPFGDSEFLFDDNGLFQSGYMANQAGWRATSQIGPDGVANDRIPGSGAMLQFGQKYQLDARNQITDTLVEDMSFNVKWTPDDAWTIELDVQRIEAETKVDDMVLHTAVNALQEYDLSGSTPTLKWHEPWGGVRDADRAAGGTEYETGFGGFSNDAAGDSNYFQDPTSYWTRSGMNHRQRSDGVSDAVRLDVKYDFDDVSFIRGIQGGYRFAERDQTVRSTDYGWAGIAPEYSAGTLFLDMVPEQQGYYELVDWSDFHKSGSVDIPGNKTIHFKQSTIRDFIYNWDCANPPVKLSAGGSFSPWQCKEGKLDNFFDPSEITTTTETNNAAYVRLDFGSDEVKYRFSGNVGLRYVKLDRKSTGYLQSAAIDRNLNDVDLPAGVPAVLTGADVLAYMDSKIADGTYGSYQEFQDDSVANGWMHQAYNYLPEADRRYGSDAAAFSTAKDSYDTLLPSLNLKVELTDELISRFAVSKAVAYPDMSLVRNNIKMGTINHGAEGIKKTVAIEAREGADQNYAIRYEDDGVTPIMTNFEYTDTAVIRDGRDWTGSGGNTYLKPMESTQYDISLEWYFAPAGSLTTTYFYKDLNNFFIKGAELIQVPHPVYADEVRYVDVDTTRNGGKGSMQGIELAYQQFFDFLPEPFDGLGVQATYTWIEASGVPNNEEDYDNADWADGGENDTGARVSLDSVPLQGQSEHTANLILMYEKNDWSARLAYNWRSKYLLTTRDVISKYPLWNDDAGFMDGSIFYNVNDNITVGLQATNLLDTQSKTLMILDDGGTEAGRSWFVQDRRVSFVVRANF